MRINSLMRRLYHCWMGGKTQVIIGTKIQNIFATYFYFRSLRANYYSFLFIKACILYFFHFFGNSLSEFWIHIFDLSRKPTQSFQPNMNNRLNKKRWLIRKSLIEH